MSDFMDRGIFLLLPDAIDCNIINFVGIIDHAGVLSCVMSKNFKLFYQNFTIILPFLYRFFTVILPLFYHYFTIFIDSFYLTY